MSRLKNAPLLEVIFEIRWKISKENEFWNKYNYLTGDIYNELKAKYPYRETLAFAGAPPQMFPNSPMYRFRTEKDSYPLVQLGPGILTFNTIDSDYDWPKFEAELIQVSELLFKLNEFEEGSKVSLVLQYIDVFEFDFAKENAHDFLKNKMNIKLQQEFFPTDALPENVNIGFYYPIEIGNLTVNITKGKNNINKKEGIMMQNFITSSEIDPNIQVISEWVSKAHDFTSQLFKDMTKGELYDSFN